MVIESCAIVSEADMNKGAFVYTTGGSAELEWSYGPTILPGSLRSCLWVSSADLSVDILLLTLHQTRRNLLPLILLPTARNWF